ncbi:MAG: peptide chain release factor N(5)-glutamine methyltransferase [Deferribacterales bacterium]
MKIAEYLKHLQSEYFQNRSDAIEFLSHISGIAYDRIPLSLSEEVDTSDADALLERFRNGEPLAYIINNKNFYGTDMYVDENVLIPRPETEILIDEVLKFANGKENLRILDICTGSGCILTTLLSHLPNSTGIGVDISEGALGVTAQNLHRQNLSDRAGLICGDALRLGSILTEKFDIITCNPPYLSETEWESSDKSLKYEPKIALSAGDDDLLFYKKILDMIPELCNKSWCGAFFELGLGQYEKLIAEGYAAGWAVIRDYQQIERVVSWTNL